MFLSPLVFYVNINTGYNLAKGKDFGRKRYEYAIINLDILNILNIPKESTDYMSLYSEAMLED